VRSEVEHTKAGMCVVTLSAKIFCRAGRACNPGVPALVAAHDANDSVP
jgi:hypothetical protein